MMLLSRVRDTPQPNRDEKNGASAMAKRHRTDYDPFRLASVLSPSSLVLDACSGPETQIPGLFLFP
jgi:hypothetical protein